MKKQVILHIGAAKCGSTAIQDFLDLNQVALRRNGILVPSIDMKFDGPVHGNHIMLFEEAITNPTAGMLLQDSIHKLIEDIQGSSISKVIISAENISNQPSVIEFLAQCKKVDFTIVCYVRRQDDFLISGWRQWGLKTFDSFADYLSIAVGELGDWNRMIAPLEAAFGRNRIRVRPFRRDRLLGGDVVADFCDTVGIDCPECINTGINANPSLNEHLGEMANRIRDVFKDPHDKDFLEVISGLIGSHAFQSDRRSFLMDIDQRMQIYRRYFDSNEALKQRYFPDWGDAPLFEPPGSSDCSTPSDVEKLRAESALLLRAVYGLALQLRAGMPPLAAPTGFDTATGGAAPAAAGNGADPKEKKRRVDARRPWTRQLTKRIRHASKLLWPGT
jgi:hypothetical protein